MIYINLKSCFHNNEPKLLNYRDFQHFSQEDFKEEFREALFEYGNLNDGFDRIFKTDLNKYAPKKKSGLGKIISPI